MPIIQANNADFTSEIIDLYINTFSTGLSEQYINVTELHQYIDAIQAEGNSLLALDNGTIIGALLSCPLLLDNSVPLLISNNFELDKCVYVAEIMVTESARGMGIGTKLLNEFFQTVDKSIYTDAFIRVLDENLRAISLYQKVGFQPIAT